MNSFMPPVLSYLPSVGHNNFRAVFQVKYVSNTLRNSTPRTLRRQLAKNSNLLCFCLRVLNSTFEDELLFYPLYYSLEILLFLKSAKALVLPRVCQEWLLPTCRCKSNRSNGLDCPSLSCSRSS